MVIKDNILYHHGVKGMKWGVRRDRTPSGNKRKLSSKDKNLSAQYRKYYNISKKDANALASERNKKVKKILIGAGIATGTAVVTLAAIKYGRMYGDDILRAGTKIQTVHHDTKIIDTGKFYTTNKALDKIKYIGEFGKTPDQGLKKKITADIQSNIKSLGVKNGEKLYNELVSKSPEFRKAVMSGNRPINYRDFNRGGLLGDGRYVNINNVKEAQRLFFDAAKNKGYGAIADANDRINSGFHTHANIVFNTSSISNIKVSDLNKDEYLKDKALANIILQAQNTATPFNAIKAGVTSAALGVAYVDRSMNKTMAKKYKKKKLSPEEEML